MHCSLVPWQSIGRQGKDFITSGPTKEQLSEYSGQSAQHPLRVYVGLRSRKTAPERAQLALEELKRVGGFKRSLLVVATPTGTGWLDPGATDTLEYLHGGDTAIVSMQYSYPIITFLQIAFDLPMATSVPIGYGHNYAPANYLDAWIVITDPPGWDANSTKRLKQVLAD